VNTRLRKNLRFIEGDEGGAVSAPAESETSTDALGGTVQPKPNDGGGNPAWNEYLERFPEPVRHIARDTFSEWDKQVQGQFTQIRDLYKPYQKFVDDKVDPARLEAAYGVAQTLEQDPQGFARLLADHLGLTIQEAQAVVADQIEQGQQEEVQGQESDDPRIAQLMQQVQQFEQFFQQQQEQEYARQAEAQLNTELDALKKQYGAQVIDQIQDELFKEANRIIAAENRPVTLQEAYANLESFAQRVRSVPRPGQLAPQVLSGGSSVPLSKPDKSMGQLSGSETRNLVAEMIARDLAAS
jgi:hypothetical protein